MDIKTELEKYCTNVKVDNLSEEKFVTFNLRDGLEQSSTTVKKDGGTNFRDPGIRATGVRISLPTIPQNAPDTAEENFDTFVTSSDFPRRPGQYNAAENTAWISYSNMSIEKFIEVVEFLVENATVEELYQD